MNGAESLVRTLLKSGVDTCFANPGTSEMYFVAALNRVPGMRCVLGTAEIVVTGSADGYARMTGRPAATLLHCGPGFANGISNLHNARRAHSPVVNIVGDLATSHVAADPPLASDSEGLARTISHWVMKSPSSSAVGANAALAVSVARTSPGQIATVIVPADTSWGTEGVVAEPLTVEPAPKVATGSILSIASILRRKEPSAMVLSGPALSAEGLATAERIANATGIHLLASSQVARMARGRGRPHVERVPYAIDDSIALFRGVKNLILVASSPPTAFFAHPGKPTVPYPCGVNIQMLARPNEDVLDALERLADEVCARKSVLSDTSGTFRRPIDGALQPSAFAKWFAALLPENCIVVDEGITSTPELFAATFDAAPHDWLQLTGGATGQGFPCATGAAIACPGRKVVCLEADGAGMYSLQALWTQARESLDIINIVFANRKYKVLQEELSALGAESSRVSQDLLELARPALDWVKLGEGMGVDGIRVDTVQGFADAFRFACGRHGPFNIELVI